MLRPTDEDEAEDEVADGVVVNTVMLTRRRRRCRLQTVSWQQRALRLAVCRPVRCRGGEREGEGERRTTGGAAPLSAASVSE
jgi:hypothetical protein